MPPSPHTQTPAYDALQSPTVTVVLPALNEEDNLPLVLEGLPDIVAEVVVVDGGSVDDTVAVAREVRPDARIVRQTRTGKGNALACGFAAATGDIVVTLNADGSTDPGEIPRYVDALLAGAEVAHGSRFRPGGGDYDGDRWATTGNRILNWLVNMLFGTRFTDLGFGYNALWRSLVPALGLPEPHHGRLSVWGDGSEIEPLINIRMATRGLRVVEVASIGYPPIHGDPERHRLRACVRALRTVAAEYVDRWRITRAARRKAAAERPVSSVVTPHRTGATATRAERTRAGRAAQHARDLLREPDQPRTAYRGPDPRVDPYPSGAFPAMERTAPAAYGRHAAAGDPTGSWAAREQSWDGHDDVSARHRAGPGVTPPAPWHLGPDDYGRQPVDRRQTPDRRRNGDTTAWKTGDRPDPGTGREQWRYPAPSAARRPAR